MKRIEKETRREIVEKTVIYEAVDGMTFSSEENCRKYEESYECTVKACFLKVPHYETNSYDLYFQGESEDSLAYVMKPRNIEDIYAINAAFNFVDTYTSKKELLTQDDIGKVIMISFGYDGIVKGGWYWFKRKDDYLKEIENALNKMEEKIVEK